MLKILYIIILSLIVTNCALKEVVELHGVPYLEKKQKSLIVNKSNKNDIKKILGNPSTTSKFDDLLWIYIERKQTQSNIKNLGQMKIFENNVLVLEIDNYGILKKKEFYDREKMENIKIAKDITNSDYQRNTFVYSFWSSMRQKVNDPLGRRAKKREAINRR